MSNYIEKTKNFSLNEFIKSNKANELKIDNTPNEEQKQNISKLMLVLQQIRDKFNDSIQIESGFRCEALNKAVGGATNSAHKYGLAADIYPSPMYDKVKMKKLQDLCLTMVKSKEILIDQLIIEKPDKNGVASWLHIGVEHPTTKAKRQEILTL